MSKSTARKASKKIEAERQSPFRSMGNFLLEDPYTFGAGIS
ncbi:hypothetical protein [Roseimaritima multifibrata]|nr:hypothetical protein [Roseimaritima multifibrata]